MESTALGHDISLWLVLPFVGMLLSVALLPLVAGDWFGRHRSQALVAAAFGVPVIVYLLVVYRGRGLEAVMTTAADYVSFIVLLAALFTIAGGIYVSGNLLGTPRSNVTLLLVGAVLANFVGTTGAAMILVRPVLRANSERTRRVHVVVFLIIVVCNLGGLLTPLGDPPLFLGFLDGVSFWWTLRLLPQWALAVGLVLAAFFFLDRYHYRREPAAALALDEADYVPLRVVGKLNIALLAGVVACVLVSPQLAALGGALHVPFVRELLMVGLAFLSLRYGPQRARHANHFAWRPMIEVGIVFAGIFASMLPTLAILRARGPELGLTSPWQYYWVTGALSSFLDNAPSYLTLGAAAQGYVGVSDMGGLMSTQVVAGTSWSPAAFLAAISCGAVMMGANSYIGNAPNFMVRSIAEHHGVAMPHFFAYMGYAALVLLPVFALVTVVFFV